MKKDYYITLTERDRSCKYSEKRFVIRAKNALRAEIYVFDLIENFKKKDKKDWVIWNIRRI